MNPYARCGSAVSAEAYAINKAASAVIRSSEDSQSLFGGKAAAIAQLLELANDCGKDGWDGDDAYAINPEALKNAEDLIRALPDRFPVPVCAPEPDGAISLDWIQSIHCLFSISVSRSDRLAYAWLDGTDKGNGVARFDGFSLPARVLNEIQAIVNHGKPSLRAA